MAIKNTNIVIPSEAGIASVPGHGLQENPGFRQDDRIVGLLGCRNNNRIYLMFFPVLAMNVIFHERTTR